MNDTTLFGYQIRATLTVDVAGHEVDLLPAVHTEASAGAGLTLTLDVSAALDLIRDAQEAITAGDLTLSGARIAYTLSPVE